MAKNVHVTRRLQQSINSDFFYLWILIIAAFPPRIWNLSRYPQPIVDEAANIRQLSTLLFARGFFPAHFGWDGSQSTLFYYPTVALIRIFNIYDIFFALRLVSVIFSLAALIPFYFLVKRCTTPLIAFCTTLLFSYSYYYLQFSRVGWSAIYSLTIGLYLIWIVSTAIRKHSAFLYMAAGIVAGIGFYTYQMVDIYIIASLGIIGHEWVRSKDALQKKSAFLIVFVISFIFISLPWILQIISHLSTFTARAHAVSIFSISFPYHGVSNFFLVTLYQITITIASWVFLLPIRGGGIENSRYLPEVIPVISPFLIPFFFIGIVQSFKAFKKMYVWFLLFGLGLFGQVLTINPPNGARGLIMAPVLYMFVGQGIYFMYRQYPSHTERIQQSIIIGALIIAFSDFLFYTQWMSWIRIINR